MFRKVNALHQVWDEEQNNLEFLIEWDNQNLIKTVFQKLKIITLTMEEFKENYETFWEYIIQFNYNNVSYNIVINSDDIVQTCTNFMKTTMNITNVSKTDWSLSKDEVDNLLNTIKETLKKEKEAELEEQLEEEKSEEKKFSSATRDKVAVIIWQTIEDIENLQKKWTEVNVFSSIDLKQLEDFKWDLMKLKRWTNADKMTTLLEDVFILMEKLEIQYLEFMKTQETKIIWTSNISDVDVNAEYDKRQRSKKVAESWASKSMDDNYYLFLWKIWLFIMFIKKDFTAKVGKITSIINNIALYIEFVIILLSIELWFSLSFLGLQQKWFYLYLINIWTLWFAMTAMKIVKFNNTIMIILRAVLSFWLYMIAYNFLSVNFSL